jgi:hypothetical protein
MVRAALPCASSGVKRAAGGPSAAMGLTPAKARDCRRSFGASSRASHAIGFAYGVSTLYICEALAEVNPPVRHTSWIRSRARSGAGSDCATLGKRDSVRRDRSSDRMGSDHLFLRPGSACGPDEGG